MTVVWKLTSTRWLSGPYRSLSSSITRLLKKDENFLFTFPGWKEPRTCVLMTRVFVRLIWNPYLVFFRIKPRRGVRFFPPTMIKTLIKNRSAGLVHKTVIGDYCFHVCGYRAQFCLNTWLDIQAFGYFFFGKPITHLSIQTKQANRWDESLANTETIFWD